jgi:hypothetical protein
MAEKFESGMENGAMGTVTGMAGIVDGPGSGAAGVAAIGCEMVVMTFHSLSDGAYKEHVPSV